MYLCIQNIHNIFIVIMWNNVNEKVGQQLNLKKKKIFLINKKLLNNIIMLIIPVANVIG